MLLLVVGLLLGSIGAGWGYAVYHRVRPELETGRTKLAEAVAELRQEPATSIQPENLKRARAGFAEAAASFNAANNDLGPVLPFLGLAGIFPGLGGDISQAPDLLSLATHAGRLGVALSDALGPALEAVQGDQQATPDGDGGLAARIDPLIAALEARPEALTRARAELAAVQAARSRINAGRASTPQVQKALDQVDAALPQLERALATVDALPRLLDVTLGRSKPTTYLLLAQNSDELRATGGFLTSVGKLTVTNGHFDQPAFEDSYAVDQGLTPPLPPPAELARQINASQWFIRDANWAPDFPTTARTAETFYSFAKHENVDGVVAVDQHTVALLVSALGPIQLEGYPDVITGQNVEDLLQHYFMPEAGGMTDAWWSHRKDFMRDLFHGLVQQMNGMDRPRLLALALALQQGLDEKHILVSLHDADTARWLHTQGWDGALLDEPGDYLRVVDTNLGFNKVNPHIVATTTYAVTLAASDAPRAVLTLTYRNSSPADSEPCVRSSVYKESYAALSFGCYWDYLRIYVPAGAQLDGATLDGAAQQTQSGTEYGKTAFSTAIVVPPGAERTLQLRYRLPAALQTAAGSGLPGGQSGYRLLVQKQPGTLARPLAVTLTLPAGVTLGQVQPPATNPGAVLHWNDLLLLEDRRLRAGW
ncbi:MAG TPA: DUF4012 domain-containing protein [Chloroflexia bacterium]|nr:DUF4012 domain-containing protein [Chloroflexia bacterium]